MSDRASQGRFIAAYLISPQAGTWDSSQLIIDTSESIYIAKLLVVTMVYLANAVDQRYFRFSPGYRDVESPAGHLME